MNSAFNWLGIKLKLTLTTRWLKSRSSKKFRSDHCLIWVQLWKIHEKCKLPPSAYIKWGIFIDNSLPLDRKNWISPAKYLIETTQITKQSHSIFKNVKKQIWMRPLYRFWINIVSFQMLSKAEILGIFALLFSLKIC